MKNALELIADERQRQIDVYGYSDDHILKSVEDYSCGELGDAAASYAMTQGFRDDSSEGHKTPFFFPWDEDYFNPSPGDRIKELVKAGAMIVAEITRLQNDPID